MKFTTKFLNATCTSKKVKTGGGGTELYRVACCVFEVVCVCVYVKDR